jgi:hypothetical protein
MAQIRGVFGDPCARVIRLERTGKKQSAVSAAHVIAAITTRRCGGYGIYRVGMHESTWKWTCDGYTVGSAAK